MHPNLFYVTQMDRFAKFRKHFSTFYAEYNEVDAIEALNINK